MGKLIKIQWIPSHIIPENDVADKAACGWQTVLEYFPECGETVLNLRRSLHCCRIGVWEEIKGSLKIGEYINNIFEWRLMTSGLRRCGVIMARFRCGCVGLNKYLFKL